MLSNRAIGGWSVVHRWTSLACTAFLLMLCLTGLPLIFHQEIEAGFGRHADLPPVPPGTPAPSLDRIVATVLATRPGEVVQIAYFDPARPVIAIATAPAIMAPPDRAHLQSVDLRTGRLLPPPPPQAAFLDLMRRLHTQMLAGLPGTLFLGAMALVFIAALVSGVVLYAPFMRRLAFGTVRATRSRRLAWLDRHNLLGICLTAWLLLVALTGAFNTLDAPLAMQWRQGQLAEMMAPYRHAPPPVRHAPLDRIVAAARTAAPGMTPGIIAFPGSFFATPSHYDVFMTGRTPLTARLIRPTLIDAATARLVDSRDMPLHIRALFLSRPLHFGDYGGLALKIVWALLDIVAIVVLASGLYLWAARHVRGAAA